MNMNIKTQNGFSLVETLVTVTIVSFMFAGGYVALSSGQSSWYTSEAGIEIQENLRKALDQMTQELRQSRSSEATIVQGTGFNNSDVVVFSIPVVCHAGDNLLDGSGDIAHWGATTRWGCRDAACMDADDSCSTVEYKYIRYILKAGNILSRVVLDSVSVAVKEDVIARNIKDFQMVHANATDPLTLTVTAEVPSVLNRIVTLSVQSELFFRNQ